MKLANEAWKPGPVKRHVARLMRPTQSYTSYGQVDPSQDVIVVSDIPVSIEAMNGRELEVARQNFPYAATKVRCFGEEAWHITPGDYWIIDTMEDAVLEIGFVRDPFSTDWEYICDCGEVIH